MNRIFKKTSFGASHIVPTVILKNVGKILPCYSASVSQNKGKATFTAEYNNLFRDAIYFDFKDDEVVCRRVFENISGGKLEVCELGFEINGVSFGADSEDDYFYHNENSRIYGTYVLPVDYDRSSPEADNSSIDIEVDTSMADPETVCERIGASPYQPFPAVLLSNYGIKEGLIHGTLLQDIFYHNYTVKHENGKINFNIFSSFKGIDALQMSEEKVLIDEWYLGTTDEADDIEKIFARYTAVLRKKLPCSYGRTDINRKTMLWGSWNDGILRNVTEEIMLEEAQFISDNFPTVGWIQLDDGYSAVCTKIAHGLGLPYEGEEGIDKEKFPHGLRWLTDKIREMGIRPAFWFGGFVPHIAPLYQDHPDWFVDYSYRVTNTSPLDVSQPQVREYMLSAINTLFRKYGFEGMKHDFWSYSFEDRHNLLKNKDKSGYEHRRWWISNLRAVLPKDGYMQTACDICMGNPFLAEFYTNYRYGLDVGSGSWRNIKKVFTLGATSFTTHTGDLFPPNSDSVGLLEGLSPDERMLLINYCIATHSMVELAGRLSKVKDREKIKQLKKAVCNPNNGQDVYFIGFDYRSRKHTNPEIMYFMSPHFSAEENNPVMPVRTLALFNLDEEKKSYSVKPKDMKLPAGDYILTDVWSGETFELKNFVIELDAHQSRLLAVSEKKTALLIDANIRINRAKESHGKLILETDYGEQETELTLTRTPSKVLFDGCEIKTETNENKLCFAVPAKGTIEIIL